MSKALLIQVKVFDTETHEVVQQVVQHYDGTYGYEVERVFRTLGENMAKVVDPYHDV